MSVRRRPGEAAVVRGRLTLCWLTIVLLLGARLHLAAAPLVSPLKFMMLMMCPSMGLLRLQLGRLPLVVVMFLPRLRTMFPQFVMAVARLAAWLVFCLILPRLQFMGPCFVHVNWSRAAWLVLLGSQPRMRVMDLLCMAAPWVLAAWLTLALAVRCPQLP